MSRRCRAYSEGGRDKNAAHSLSSFGYRRRAPIIIFTRMCACRCSPTVNLYAAGASGNAAPIATINGSNTGMTDSSGKVALDNDSNIYVATAYSITAYAAGTFRMESLSAKGSPSKSC